MSAETEKKIRQALLRIKKGLPKIVSVERKLSMSAVADEAGIHLSTIINRYPVIADEIRGVTGKKAKTYNSRVTELEIKLSEAKNEIELLKNRGIKQSQFKLAA